MPIRVVMSGATGWVGKALIPAIVAEKEMALAGAVARNAAGQDAGAAVGAPAVGIVIAATLEEALRSPSDVVVDYTKPDAVKAHAPTAVSSGRNVVIGTSGLGLRTTRRLTQLPGQTASEWSPPEISRSLPR